MKKIRVLYVEDEAGVARLLKRNLELMDRYEMRVEIWPEDALETAREFKPDLVLLDLIMPRLPGGNVAAAFGADPELKDLPILFFTASVWPEQLEESGGVLCDRPCLAKPSHLDEIIEFIENNLPAHLRRKEISKPSAHHEEPLEEATSLSSP